MCEGGNEGCVRWGMRRGWYGGGMCEGGNEGVGGRSV